MFRLEQLQISWDGPADTSFWDDLTASNEVDEDVRAHLVFSTKKNSLILQAAGIGSVAQLVPTMLTNPAISGILALALLAILSPITLDHLSDQEAQFLNVFDRLKTDTFINATRLRTLLQDDPLVDQLIESLVDKGLLKRTSDGKLKLQRKILANLNIGI